MIKHYPNIALVTPLKDEYDNIDTFFSSLSNQTMPIKLLVIVENDSTDGSREYLNQINSIENIEILEIINLSFENKEYNVENKYSSIVDKGFDCVLNHPCFKEIDFLGILDSDCFPYNDYYEKLTNFMLSVPKLGIASGVIHTSEGVPHVANPNWVRGGCRLWSKECFMETGFPLEPSPDAVSVALAHIHGWKTQTLKNAFVISREVNERLTNYKNLGQRAYYRGNSPIFAILKFIHFAIRKKRPKVAVDHFKGYFGDLIKNKPKIKDERVKRYFQYYVFNNLVNRMFK